MWFYPMLRELVTYSLNIRRDGEREILRMTGPVRDQIVYKNPQEEHVTVFKSGDETSQPNFETKSWEQVCQKGSTPWYDQLFGDDQGPLVL